MREALPTCCGHALAAEMFFPQPAAATNTSAFHFVYQGDCCYSNTGRRLLTVNLPSRMACQERCLSDERCNYISVKHSSHDSLCVLCATCTIRKQSGHFSSWSRTQMPAPVDSIAPFLQGDYSTRLYGSPNMVEFSSLRVVWLQLLPEGALQLIARMGGVCKYESGYPWRPFFMALDIFANPVDAMWVSWERATLAGFPVANKSWVEVTHCSQGRGSVGKSKYAWQFGPMWLYAAPGSGVSINVGRTVVMSHADAARLLRRVYPSALECACEPQCEFGLKPESKIPVKNGSSCITHFTRSLEAEGSNKLKSLQKYTRCWTREAVIAELDTIQIFDHVEYFGRERRHEIVRLRHAGECSTLTPDTPQLMCGRFPHLSHCPPNSTVLRRINRCGSSAHSLSQHVGAAVNATGGRCQMTSVY